MICDNAFTFNNAKVFCRTLGLPEGNVKFSDSFNMTFYDPKEYIGDKPTSFQLFGKDCNGTEATFNDCAYTK